MVRKFSLFFRSRTKRENDFNPVNGVARRGNRAFRQGYPRGARRHLFFIQASSYPTMRSNTCSTTKTRHLWYHLRNKSTTLHNKGRPIIYPQRPTRIRRSHVNNTKLRVLWRINVTTTSGTMPINKRIYLFRPNTNKTSNFKLRIGNRRPPNKNDRVTRGNNITTITTNNIRTRLQIRRPNNWGILRGFCYHRI